MKHPKTTRKASLFFFLALILLGPSLAAQSIRLRAQLNEVSYIYDNEDYYGPDIRWKWSGTVSVSGITKILTASNYSIEDGNYGVQTFTVNRNLINEVVPLPTTDNNTSLNLCDDIVFTINLEAWEEDGGSGTSFDDGDDDHYTATYTFTLSSGAAGEWQRGATQGNGTYKFQFQFLYDLDKPIESLTVTDDAGIPIASKNLCASTEVRLTAERSPGFTSGRFAFERKEKNTENWSSPFYSTTNYLSILAEDLLTYDYRVSTDPIFNCFGDPAETIALTPATSVTIFPSFENSIPHETVASCENSNTGMVIYTGRDLGEGIEVELVLEKRVGSEFEQVGDAHPVLPEERDTFRNLDGGSYRLLATVVPTTGEVANCTSEEAFILRESFGPVLWGTSVVPPTCTEPTGELRVTIGRRSLLQHTFKLYEADSPGVVFRQSEPTFLRDYIFEELPPGNYFLEVTDEVACSFLPVDITIPEQPGQASGTVIIDSDSEDFDIECTGGTTMAIVSVPSGQGDYRVEETRSRQFFEVSDGGSVLVPIRTFNNFKLTRLESGCSTVIEVLATENPTPVGLTISEVTQLTGCMPTGGSFTATVDNGTPPYTFSIVDGESVTQDAPSYLFDELGAGFYRVNVMDSRGCNSIDFVYIETVGGLQLTAAPEPITCIGETDGMVLLTGAAGRSPYQYKIGGGDFQDEPGFTDLAPGSYVATVRDADMCEATAAFTVLNQDEIVITNAFSDPIDCNGHYALPQNYFNVFVEGRVTRKNYQDCESPLPTVSEMYEVSFDGGNTFNPINQFSSSNPLGDDCSSDKALIQLTGIVSGYYDLQIRDINGCLSNVVTVTPEVFPEPDPVVVTITEIRPATCFGAEDGSISVHIEGGNPGFQLILYEHHDTRPDDNHDLIIIPASTDDRDYTFVNVPASTYNPGEPFGLEGPGGYRLKVKSKDSQPRLIDFYRFGDSLSPEGCYADAVNPTDPTRPIEIFEPDTLIVGEVILDPASDIRCDGSGAVVTINQVSGGTPPYEYSTTGTDYDPSNILFPAVAGAPLFVKDANQCAITVPFPDFTLPPGTVTVAFEVLSFPSSCMGGKVLFAPAGGRPPYSISLVPFAGDALYGTSEEGEPIELDGVRATSYFITVEDIFGCRLTQEFTLDPGEELRGETTEIVDESCLNQEDGSVTIEVFGGKAPYQISYNGEVTTEPERTVSGLTEGNHTFIIIDALDCSTVHEVFVDRATQLDLVVETTSPTPCADSENGTMLITPSGGTAPYQLEWLFDPTLNTTLQEGESATFTDLASIEEEYAMRVTDASGCSQRIDRFLAWADPIEVDLFNFNPGCESLGAVNLLISNGTPPYQVSINGAPPVTETFFNNLPEGEYNFTVTDANGCSYERGLSTTLVNDENIGIYEIASGGGLCYDPVGTITILGFTGRNATFRLNGGPAQSSSVFTGLAGGRYTLEITLGECTETVENIGVPGAPPINLIQTRTEDPCTGEVDISLIGESPRQLTAYTIDGVPYTPEEVVRFLPGNSYEVAITDFIGCVYTEVIEIAPFTPLSISGSEITDAACEDGTGQAAVTVIGGTPPYSFAWSNGGPADSLFLGADAGAYQVTVSNANGCTVVSQELMIDLIGNGRPVISLQQIQAATCAEGTGSITVSVSSGVAPYTYTWSHDPEVNAPSATMLNSGNYSLTVTDAVGCRSILESLEVGFIAGIQVVMEVTPSTCGLDNGSIRAVVSGGEPPFTYQWSHDPDLTGDIFDNYGGTPPNTAGAIAVLITDANGCLGLGRAVLISVAALTLEVLNNTPSTCGAANGRLEVGISGDPNATTSVSWAHDPNLTDTNLDNLLSGTYFLTVNDDRGCTTTGEYIVTNSDGPTLQGTTAVDARCEEGTGSLTLEITEGTAPYRYTWEHDPDLTDNTAGNLAAGTYRVTVTDANDCALNLAEEITFIAPPAVVLTPSLPNCENLSSGRIASNVSGGTPPFTYAWSNGSVLSDLENVPSGDYTLTVTDASGCTAAVISTVGPRVPPTIELATTVDVACAQALGSAAFLVRDVTDGAVFSFSNPGIVLMVEDLGGGTRRVTANALTEGDYQFSVVEFGCDAVQTVTINTLPAFALLEADNQAVSCFGEADGAAAVAIVGGNLGFGFRWDANAGEATTPTVNGLPAGSYTVTVTSSRGCTQSLNLTITEPAPLQLSAAAVADPTCFGDANGSITVSGSGGTIPYNFGWREPGLPTSETVQGLPAGTYQAIISDAQGCTTALNIELAEGARASISGVPADTMLCLGNIYVLDLSEYPGASITGPGGFNSMDPVSLLETAGEYTIDYTNNMGCSTSFSTRMNVTTERFTARMVLPTDAVVTLPVAILEAGFPVPDQVAWVVDESRVTRTGQTDNVHFFEFSEPGVYDIGMVASFGGCEDALSKQITIHQDSTTIPGAILGASEIISATAAPNPNNGQFTFMATLAAPQPLTLTFFRSNGSEIDRRRIEGLSTITEAYDLSLEAGTYYLQAQAGNERRMLAVIVQ